MARYFQYLFAIIGGWELALYAYYAGKAQEIVLETVDIQEVRLGLVLSCCLAGLLVELIRDPAND